MTSRAIPRGLLFALSGVLVLGTAAALGAAFGWRALNAPLDLPEGGMLYQVERGASLARVTRDLENLGVLRHPRIVDLYAGVSGAATGIHAGEYELLPGHSALSLLDLLQKGDVYLHKFTIVEGLRVSEMLARLRAHPAIAPSDGNGQDVMSALGKPDLHPEGQFLPDTYSFARGTTDVELLGWAHEALQSLLERSWDNRAESDVLTSPYQGLILASIVEKETALESERGLISGVIHERLRRGMPLQVDPTVIYGLGDSFDGDLTRAGLDTDTPYNTYTRRGLPPTPIALAGAASIEAAFAPVESGALYFVATGDPDGSHVFSRTLEEHNAAVRRYLERQRQNPE